jgi:hypothetical protein
MHEALTFWTSFEKEFAMEIAKLGVGTVTAHPPSASLIV